MAQEKILIIKTGYSEFLDNVDDGREVSYGDVFRTTPLLHAYKDEHVTWVTDEKAFPLLVGNMFIERLLSLDFLVATQLESEEFDRVINLEKVPGICALTDKIKTRRAKYGFGFDTQKGRASALDRASEVLAVSYDIEQKRMNQRPFQELLFEVVGKKWNGEGYVLGYTPKTNEEYDFGLNTNVGRKWPVKAWPKEKWDDLERRLSDKGFRVTRQDKQGPEVLTNLYHYMDWLNSSRVIVTSDSLGLHLGLALGKRVSGLFGPTPDKEVHFYGRGEAILPEGNYGCLPCFKNVCETGKKCMEALSSERVYDEVKQMWDL